MLLNVHEPVADLSLKTGIFKYTPDASGKDAIFVTQVVCKSLFGFGLEGLTTPKFTQYFNTNV